MTTVDLAAQSDLPEEDARLITAQIRDSIRVAWQLISRAYEGRVWLALGYDAWDNYLNGEFGAAPLRVPREDRPVVVTSLRDAGMSTRAIAAAAGVDHSTVVRDLGSTGANAPVGSDEAPPRVTGLDGRSRPSSRPAPPRLKELVEAAVADELATRRARIAEAEEQRREADAFNAATADAVAQRDAERPWSSAAISVTYAIERLPLDVDPVELARRVPPQNAYRLDDLAAAVDWLARLIAARREIAS